MFLGLKRSVTIKISSNNLLLVFRGFLEFVLRGVFLEGFLVC